MTSALQARRPRQIAQTLRLFCLIAIVVFAIMATVAMIAGYSVPVWALVALWLIVVAAAAIQRLNRF